MSDAVFPALAGAMLPDRTAVWDVGRKRTGSGRVFRTTEWTYPVWRFAIGYDFLREGANRGAMHAEASTLAAFFNARGGGFDTFLFTDPDGSSVSDQQIAVGDGTTVLFELGRSFGGYLEPIGKVNGSIAVEVDGTPTSVTVVDGRLIQFASAPANAAPITWSGDYYLRCAFTDDELDLRRMMATYFTSKLEFETVKP